MPEQENLQTIHHVYAAFGEGDVPGVLAALTDDVQWFTPGPPGIVPYAGKRTGHDQVSGYFTSFGEAVDVTAFEPQEFFAQGDMVVVLGHYTLQVKRTGKVIDNDWVHAFTLADNKITTFRGFEDSAAVVAAFTAKPQST